MTSPGGVRRQDPLVDDRLGLPGRCHHLPPRLHPGLHQQHRRHHHRHHHGLPLRGLLPLRHPLQHQPDQKIFIYRQSSPTGPGWNLTIYICRAWRWTELRTFSFSCRHFTPDGRPTWPRLSGEWSLSTLPSEVTGPSRLWNSNLVISERKLSRNSCCTGTSSRTQTPQTGKP